MKRRRINATNRGDANIVYQTRMKRPIDKQLISIESTIGTAQASTDLYTTTYPGTMVGLRWDITSVNLSTGIVRIWWAIVVNREGIAASNMSTSNASTFYAPESDVLAFGCSYIVGSAATGGPMTRNFEGSTKAMRKLMAGDKLRFITLADVASSVGMVGEIQFFVKS